MSSLEAIRGSDEIIGGLWKDGVYASLTVPDFYRKSAKYAENNLGMVISRPLPNGRLWTRMRVYKMGFSPINFNYEAIDHEITIGSSDDRTIPEKMQGLPVWWTDEYMREEIVVS